MLDIVLVIVISICIVIGATLIATAPKVKRIDMRRHTERKRRAEEEAQRILARTSETIALIRRSADEDLAAEEEALTTLNASVHESDRILREDQHRFNQHRYAFKQHRALLEEREHLLEERSREIEILLRDRANLPEDEAKSLVLKSLEDELASMHAHRVDHLLRQLEDPEPLARRNMTTAIQRQDLSHSTDPMRPIQIDLAEIPESQQENVRAALTEVTEATSTESTLDPETGIITIRGMDPVGREVARQASQELARRSYQIAQVPPLLINTRTELLKSIRSRGEEVMWEMEIPGREELAELIGTLHYRYSYGQNALLHCKEAGYLCGVLASELGLDSQDARHAGMLHDIGKAVDHDVEGSHAVIGAELLHLLGVPDHITHAVRAHHFEEEPSTDLAFLTICADAISASRPGARRDTLSTYLARLDQLQSIATRHRGVERAYPMHAGREVRIIVHPTKVKDSDVQELSTTIAREIESEMNYPGIIKVTVIRESSATATAPVQITPVSTHDHTPEIQEAQLAEHSSEFHDSTPHDSQTQVSRRTTKSTKHRH